MSFFLMQLEAILPGNPVTQLACVVTSFCLLTFYFYDLAIMVQYIR